MNLNAKTGGGDRGLRSAERGFPNAAHARNPGAGACLPVVTLIAWLCLATGVSAAERIEFTWPTPNKAFDEGRGPETFLQHAGTGDPLSGGFGGVRENGTQFHEGIDIRAVNRDRAGEPTDPIYAAMDGVVRYVNSRPGDSSYGRYILIEHPQAVPMVYTLYAHLSRIAAGITEGKSVRRGETIATMGRSAAGYTIPRDRAHLHFEIGLWITRDFQSWYRFRKFDSPNQHGIYNGLNLVGIDPLDFLNQYRTGKVNNFIDYIPNLETAVRIRIATTLVPDYVQRYPELLTKPLPMNVTGWDVRFAWTGLPIALTPLVGDEVRGLEANVPRIVEVNEAVRQREKSKTLVGVRRDEYVVGSDLLIVLQQLFGLR